MPETILGKGNILEQDVGAKVRGPRGGLTHPTFPHVNKLSRGTEQLEDRSACNPPGIQSVFCLCPYFRMHRQDTGHETLHSSVHVRVSSKFKELGLSETNTL